MKKYFPVGQKIDRVSGNPDDLFAKMLDGSVGGPGKVAVEGTDGDWVMMLMVVYIVAVHSTIRCIWRNKTRRSCWNLTGSCITAGLVLSRSNFVHTKAVLQGSARLT